MKAGEILRPKSLQTAHDQRQRVAHREHHRRARAGGKTERARFVQAAQRDHHLGGAAQRAVVMGRDGDHRHAYFVERRQHLNHLARLAALRKHQHYVIRMQPTQVAVQCFGRMQEMGPSASRGKRGRQFLTDVARLAHAGDNQIAIELEDQVDGAKKTAIQLFDQIDQGPSFGGNNLAAELQDFFFRAQRGNRPRTVCCVRGHRTVFLDNAVGGGK